MIPAMTDRQTDRRTVRQNSIASTALCITSYADALYKKLSSCCDSRSYRLHGIRRAVRIDALFTSLAFESSFSVHFVAKRHIPQQKCLRGQIGTCLLGTRWYNVLLAPYIDHERRSAQRHRQTDRQTDVTLMPIADHTV